MKYFSIAAHNRDLIVISDMETFAHHFCYTTKQRKGQVHAVSNANIEEEHGDISTVPVYEIDEAAISDDDEL